MNVCRIDIGKPPKQDGYNDNDGWLCTAICHPTYHPCLSQNDVSFWCNLDRYNIDIRIGRQSPEGQKIERGIRNNISLLQMEKLLLALALPHIKPHEFDRIIEHVESDAFIRGKNAVRKSLSVILTEE